MSTSTDLQNKPKYDTETKIRLLITIINDEGKDKLDASLDKLSTRLLEYLDEHFGLVKKYLVNS
jgi:hypothetical protein